MTHQASSEDIIICQHVNKWFGDFQALRDISFSVKAKEVVVIIGPSGSGKSTLIRIAATTLPPSRGSMTVCGHDPVRDPVAIRRILGYLPQDFGAYPKLKGREYLEYVAILKNLRHPRTQIEALLSQFGLTDVAARRVTTYSGGMLRRLGVAQALLGEPRVLLIDEPTSGLDPEERARFREFLMDLGGSRIVVLSTHFVEDVAATCDQLGILDRGNLCYHGAPRELIERFRGTIFEVSVPEPEAAEKTEAWGQSMLTSRRDADARIVRLTEEVEGSHEVAPTLEDAYLALLRS